MWGKKVKKRYKKEMEKRDKKDKIIMPMYKFKSNMTLITDLFHYKVYQFEYR